MSPQLENEKRPETMPVEKAKALMDLLGPPNNFLSLGADDILMDGTWTPTDLRLIADLWDACHDEEGNER